jgi:hypothetical protein
MDLIYHITHLNNLPGIIEEGLVCDNHTRTGNNRLVGRQEIAYEDLKERRRQRRVPVPPGGVLADYVPFYFCPRSPMLYAIHHRKTNYQGGQEEVVHLQVKIEAATAGRRRFVFTDRHAFIELAEFYNDLADLKKLQWDIINSDNWGGDVRRPFKQAEFLVHGRLPWSSVSCIGVHNRAVASSVGQILQSSRHKPPVTTHPSWYY